MSTLTKDNLLERMKKLREAARETNPSTKSELTNPSPFSMYLELYSKSEHYCYINYMEGAKLLKDWVGELDMTETLTKYPEITNPNFKVPSLLSGYESKELATILSGETHGVKHRIASNAIYFSMSQQVIHNLY